MIFNCQGKGGAGERQVRDHQGAAAARECPAEQRAEEAEGGVFAEGSAYAHAPDRHIITIIFEAKIPKI